MKNRKVIFCTIESTNVMGSNAYHMTNTGQGWVIFWYITGGPKPYLLGAPPLRAFPPPQGLQLIAKTIVWALPPYGSQPIQSRFAPFLGVKLTYVYVLQPQRLRSELITVCLNQLTSVFRLFETLKKTIFRVNTFFELPSRHFNIVRWYKHQESSFT